MRYRGGVSWGKTFMITTLVWLYVVVVVILMRVFAFKIALGFTYDWDVNYKFYYKSYLAVHIALLVDHLCFVLQDLQEGGGESPTTFVTWPGASENYCCLRYCGRN